MICRRFANVVPRSASPAPKMRSRRPSVRSMKDNEGKERLPAGKVITDDALSKMDYYVDGVQGKLPAAK